MRVPTLRDRLPADLRRWSDRTRVRRIPFTSVYLTDDEWAAEMANRTVQAVMHIGWVPEDAAEDAQKMPLRTPAATAARWRSW